eukprot:RCo029699
MAALNLSSWVRTKTDILRVVAMVLAVVFLLSHLKNSGKHKHKVRVDNVSESPAKVDPAVQSSVIKTELLVDPPARPVPKVEQEKLRRKPLSPAKVDPPAQPVHRKPKRRPWSPANPADFPNKTEFLMKHGFDLPPNDTCTLAIETWQDTYAVMHSEILRGIRPKRFAVAVVSEGGTGDQLTGLLTMFYYALLTGRAFQIMTYGFLPDYRMGYDAPFIDWFASYPDILFENIKNTFKGVREYSGERKPLFKHNTQAFTYWYLVNDGATQVFNRSDLRRVPNVNDSAPYAFVSSNRGRTFVLFNNPVHGPELRSLGLRAESMARCAFMFLFTPNAGTRRIALPFLSAVTDPTALRIGIQLRTGDNVFIHRDDHRVMVYAHFFDCAAQIEQDRRKPEHTKVIWYLASDSLSVRREAKNKYGEKLITNTHSPTVHTECVTHNASTCDRSVVRKAFQTAVAELYLLSRTQYHVLTHIGGFGQLAAWLSGEISHPHAYVLGHQPPPDPRPCSPEKAVSFQDLSMMWSGR